ncbi:MAG: hypothetical protein AAGF46_12295, partial [Pseudomonadota bacterium]
MMRVIGVIFGLLLVANSAARELPKSWPTWLRDAMENEGESRATTEFALANGFILGTAPGTFVSVPREVDGVSLFSVDIGAETPMECWIYADGMNSAEAIAHFGRIIIDINGSANGGLLRKDIFTLEVVAPDGMPGFHVEWLYKMGTAQVSRIGLLKLRTVVVRGVGVLCAHNFVGYRKTFARAFDFLRRELTVKQDWQPYYEAVHFVTLDGQQTGFTNFTLALT